VCSLYIYSVESLVLIFLDVCYFIVPPGHCEVVKLLLSQGVPVDPIDHRGAPLQLAVSKDHAEVLKVLLEHSADVSCLFHCHLIGLGMQKR
jgi:ankyrin repeat protein